MRIGNILIFRCFPREYENFAVKGKNLIGVEIGVYRGEHAESMLKHLDIKKLYLIDPYKEYGEVTTDNDYTYEKINNAKSQAINRLKKFKEKTKWIFKKSENSIKDIKEKLDFVYIDGAHDYENVKKDIENYWELIKIGGVIGGDDFFNGYAEAKISHTGLINAVLEFTTKYKLQLYVHGRDWWVYKK